MTWRRQQAEILDQKRREEKTEHQSAIKQVIEHTMMCTVEYAQSILPFNTHQEGCCKEDISKSP